MGHQHLDLNDRASPPLPYCGWMALLSLGYNAVTSYALSSFPAAWNRRREAAE
jgi:hypothetical protein